MVTKDFDFEVLIHRAIKMLRNWGVGLKANHLATLIQS
jgi:hypothetical protein